MPTGTDLQSLRQLALNRTTNALHRESLCLDDDAAVLLKTLEQALTKLRAKREQELARVRDGQGDQRMATDPLAEIDRLITDTETDLERQREAAAEMTVVLVFGRLAPAKYSEMIAAHADDGKLDLDQFSKALAAATFRRVEDSDGRDMDITWDEVAERVLSHGDMEAVCSGVIAHNRRAAVIPFSKRNSAKA